MSKSCLKIQDVFCSPMGFIPPLLMDIGLSGMTVLRFTFGNLPKPLQVGQAPFGELNEKELGSG